MSNKKDKNKWKKIQNNNKKICLNCCKIDTDDCGRFICTGDVVTNIIYNPKAVHLCFDKYNF